VDEWEIWDQDSCSDHIIRYAIGQGNGNNPELHSQDVRFIV